MEISDLQKKKVTYKVKHIGETDAYFKKGKKYDCRHEYYGENGILYFLGVKDEENEWEIVPPDEFIKME